jgi:hypothetical protein
MEKVRVISRRRRSIVALLLLAVELLHCAFCSVELKEFCSGDETPPQTESVEIEALLKPTDRTTLDEGLSFGKDRTIFRRQRRRRRHQAHPAQKSLGPSLRSKAAPS